VWMGERSWACLRLTAPLGCQVARWQSVGACFGTWARVVCLVVWHAEAAVPGSWAYSAAPALPLGFGGLALMPTCTHRHAHDITVPVSRCQMTPVLAGKSRLWIKCTNDIKTGQQDTVCQCSLL